VKLDNLSIGDNVGHLLICSFEFSSGRLRASRYKCYKILTVDWHTKQKANNLPLPSQVQNRPVRQLGSVFQRSQTNKWHSTNRPKI
jgi:hypothetical protein